jgi:hypothetical protein
VAWIAWVRAPGVRLAIQLLEEYAALMNTISNTLLAALAGIVLLSFASPAQAQYKPVGDVGIAASPKVRSMMMKPITSPADVVGLKDGDMVAIACPKCKTSMVTLINTEKGHIKTATTVPEDVDPGCEQKFTVVGEGKGKHNIVTHVCKKWGSTDAFCCVMKKDGNPTKGMKQK